MQSPEPDPEPSPLLPPQPYATATAEGGRKWVYPRRFEGQTWEARRAVALVLVLVYTLLPHLKLNGHPLVLLDIPARRFTLFGTEFWATDTLLLGLIVMTIVVSIVGVTAILGRVWCGWGCPQTVYLEFIFRPIETLLEGQGDKQRRFNAEPWTGRKLLIKAVKWFIFLLISMVLAHTFLAYFVGVDRLETWMQRSPIEHPLTFLIMVGITGAMLVDFGWFREQLCTIACPYGRLQSVMMDQHSLRVGYDELRGEPRGRGLAAAPLGRAAKGDCVDCGLCVATCPTGIDIRNGLQLECIGCMQCMDACDTVMDKVKKPRGLIRFATTAQLKRESPKLLRPRLFMYAGVLLLLSGTLFFKLETRADTTVNLLRAKDAAYIQLPDGRISNHLTLKVSNRAGKAETYKVELLAPTSAQLILTVSPLTVEAGQMGQSDLIVMLPKTELVHGKAELKLVLRDSMGGAQALTQTLIGPVE